MDSEVACVFHLQGEDGEKKQHDGLQHREEAEAEHIAKHKLQLGHGRGSQAFHRTLVTLSEERDAGEQEDKEEADVGYEDGREEIEHLQVGAAIEREWC